MILVTGATGTNGRELIRELLAAGEKVRAGARNPGKAGLPAGAETVRLDFGDSRSIEAALHGVDRVFLLSPDPSAESADTLMLA